MRLMLVALLILSGAWAAFWWIGSGAEKARIAILLEANPKVTHSTQMMRGFPNRFDTTLENVAVDAGSLQWQMPRLQLFRLSYQPGHYVVSFAPEQSLTLGETPLSLIAEDARASVVFRQNAFDHSNAVVDALTVTADAGWELMLPNLLFGTRQVADGLEVGIRIAGLQSGDAVTNLELNGVLTFPGGVPDGVLSITASDLTALRQIAEIVGLPDISGDDAVTFSNGQVSIGDTVLGAAPVFPIQ